MEGKGAVAAALLSLALVFSLAGFLFPFRGGAPAAPTMGPPGEASPPPAAWDVSESPGGTTVRLLLSDGQVTTLDLEDYLVGVLAAEMPASFESAALEAQAVAARTYALSHQAKGPHLPQADVCTDFACCQAYLATPPASWGAATKEYSEKLRAAVDATAGQVLTQDGALIDAVFHASSLGQTAPAQAVWGAAVPYLVSVSTPETAENVPDLRQEAAFTPEELEALLGPGELGETVYEPWGGVATLAVGERLMSGTEVRKALGLRSTRFSIERRGDQTVFITSGYGHGVGMSQRGADLMAKEGATYQEILAHYYPGTTLERR